jgi:hypothetical protein
VDELEPALVAQQAALAALEAVLGNKEVEQPIGIVVQYGYRAASDVVATVWGMVPGSISKLPALLRKAMVSPGAVWS